MDRLPAVIAAALALAACGDQDSGAAGPGSRVDTIAAAPAKKVSVEDFCDRHWSAAEGGPALKIPPHTGAPPAPGPAGWRWVNIWATWCKPCLEEMPRLLRWRDKLAAAGRRVDLQFVSVDESDQELASYLAAHTELPRSARLTDPAGLPAWLTALGLDAGAPIPVHAMADGSGRLRCVRAGGVGEKDFAVIEQLLAGEG